MTKQIKVSSVVEGKSGTKEMPDGKRYDWTMYNITSEAGETFTCFKKETAEHYRSLIGQQAPINFTSREFKGKVYFNVIEGEKAQKDATILEKLTEILQNQAEMKRLITAQAVKPTTPFSSDDNSIPSADDQPVLQPDGATTTPNPSSEAPEPPVTGGSPSKGSQTPIEPEEERVDVNGIPF